jgi:hypothetical protein
MRLRSIPRVQQAFTTPVCSALCSLFALIDSVYDAIIGLASSLGWRSTLDYAQDQYLQLLHNLSRHLVRSKNSAALSRVMSLCFSRMKKVHSQDNCLSLIQVLCSFLDDQMLAQSRFALVVHLS